MSGPTGQKPPARFELPARFNLGRWLLDANLDAGRGEKIALRWRDESHTYAQLVDASDRLAAAFRDLGLRPEERVLIAAPDRPEWCHAWFATLKAGGVFAMVNTLLTEEDYDYYLGYSRAAIAVVDESLAPVFARLAPRHPWLRAVVVLGGETSTSRPNHVDGQHLLVDLIEQAPGPLAPFDSHKHDLCGWLFTSGSTGHPKAAVHFHEDFAFNIERYALGVLGIREDDVTSGVPKLFFGYATGNNLMFTFRAGGSTALFSERSTPEALLAHIERYRPTILTSVPTMIGRMLELDAEREQAGEPRYDLSSLRLVTSAGEKLPDPLHRRWLDRFGVEILDGIGSAELFHVYISNRPGAVRFGSLGQAVPGYDCRVVDDAGSALPPGSIGRLHVRGESAALCYWQDHEKSKDTFAGDLVISGDLFRRDDEGYFFYEGRADDLLKVGGVWVAPHEIEECLLAHPDIEQAAVVGWLDADKLVKPKAFVVLGDGLAATLRDDAAGGRAEVDAVLTGWCKDHLAPYKYPRAYEYLDDLPRNDRGKVDRKALKARQETA